VHFYGGEEGLVPSSGDGRLSCKFLLVSDRSSVHLVFGPLAQYPYHAGLLDRFCSERHVAAGWVQRPDLLEIIDDSYRVLGGGYLELDPVRRAISVSGQSKAYGDFDRCTIERIINGHAFFVGFSWSFE
jgi:hypothetical protein